MHRWRSSGCSAARTAARRSSKLRSDDDVGGRPADARAARVDLEPSADVLGDDGGLGEQLSASPGLGGRVTRRPRSGGAVRGRPHAAGPGHARRSRVSSETRRVTLLSLVANPRAPSTVPGTWTGLEWTWLEEL